jgi:hypothetical protein
MYLADWVMPAHNHLLISSLCLSHLQIHTHTTCPLSQDGGTQLSYGLQYIRETMLPNARPESAGIPRVLIVLTDGKSNYGFEPLVLA